jgi:hypothetical protein
MGYIPSSVRYNAVLTAEAKLLYAELTAMCGIDGRCKLDYTHLTNVFTRNTVQIKVLLNSLYKTGAIGTGGDGFITLIGNAGVQKKTMLENVDTPFIDEIVDVWNELFKKDIPRGIRKTAKLTKMVTERQVTFSKEEIMTSLKNRHDYVSRNDWHNISANKHHKVNILIVLADDDKVQEFLNMEESNATDMKRQTVAVKKEKSDENLLE